MEQLLIICVIGAIAGLIASTIVKYDSGNFLVDILTGIVGGYVGYKLFGSLFAFTGNIWLNKIFTAAIGAVVLDLVLKLLQTLIRHAEQPRQDRHSRHC